MTQRTSRLHRGAEFVRERSGRVRERLRPRNLCAPFGMLASSILVGKRADQFGYRPLLVIGFAMLPGRAVLTVLSGDPVYLVSIQLIGGIGTGLFAALTPIWLADETQGTGRYNLAQGTMATMRSLGATASGLCSQLIVEHLGYPAAFSACGIVGAAAAVLLWLGLPQRKPSPAKQGWARKG